MDDILKDSRFSKLLNDPRYRQIPKHERKVKIDKRFESMFKDEKFKVKYTVDKRGRPVNETSTENLRKYYDVESNEDDSSDDESGSEELGEAEDSGDSNEDGKKKDFSEGKVKIKLKKKVKKDGKSSAGQFVKPLGDDTDDDPEKEVPSKEKNDKLVRGKLDKHITNKLHDMEIDYARGEGVLLTDSSSDDDSSDEETGDSDLEHNWGELDADAESIDESTERLAICNMDWDNIKANDIMVLLNSFLPTGGVIKKITIYPSDYGIKRMKEEDLKGPMELTKKTKDDVILSDHSDNEEGSKYHMEKLRKYQLNRLKYYYAVVECDSVKTADKLYSECNGLEYESSSTKLDLRFIPDDVTFEQEAREVCTKLPDLSKYRPRMFTTTALQQSKVNLTWDVTNPNRSDAIKNAMDGDMDEADLKEYLATSSDDSDEEDQRQGGMEIENVFENVEDDDDEEDPIQKYKSLLQDIQNKEQKKKNKDVEMEVTWGLGVKEKAEELVKKKITEGKEKQTPFEELMEKRREKKKQKKLERKQKIETLKEETATGKDEESDNDIPSDIDMNDPYFAEEFKSSEFKKKKNKKKHESEEEIDEEEERRKAELELLLDDDDDGREHFSLKKIQASETETKKSRRKKKLREKIKEIKNSLPDFEINTKDERFSAIYNSHLYNIDPTDSNYKKTKGMEKLIEEKLKRRPAEMPVEVSAPKKTKEQAELSLLVKNIKKKTKDIVK